MSPTDAGTAVPAPSDVPPDGAARRIVAVLRAGGGWLAVAPLVLWWAVWRGGLATTLVVPGLVWLALAAALLTAAVPARRPSRAVTVTLLGLGTLLLLTAASTRWSSDRGAAADAGLRLAVIVGAFALVGLWPPSARGLRILVVLAPVAALVGLVAGLLGALGDPGSLIDGRLSAPTDYPNATALLCVVGALPALVLAADPTRTLPGRALLTGTATALIGGAVLPQSRSVLLLGVAAIALVLAAAPFRARICAAGVTALVLVAAVSPALLGVRRSALAGNPDPALTGLIAIAGLLLAGSLVSAAGLTFFARHPAGQRILARLQARQRRILRRPAAAGRPRPSRRTRRVRIATVSVVAVVSAAALANATAGSDIAAISHPDYDQIESSGTRFSAGLRSNRPDYWRVALRLTREHPGRGVGAGNFAERYLPLRHTVSTPEAAHSTWLGTAASLGVPGLLALLAAALAAAVGVLGRLRATVGSARTTVIAAALPALILAVDAAVDWTARFPLLAVLALSPIAAVAGPATRRSRLPTLVPVALVVGLALAATAGARPFLAAQHTTRAVAIWRTAPAAADADLRRAAALVPHDARPVIQRGVLDISRGRWTAAAEAMTTAARRDPQAWYPHLALAALAARAGDRSSATAELRATDVRVAGSRRAQELRQAIADGRPVDPQALQRRTFRQGP